MEDKKKKCTACREEFLIISQELNFLDEKCLPMPEECPLCRQKRRLSKRSEQKFYNHRCNKCGKDIIIAYKPPKEQKVYCKSCYLDFYNTFDPTSES